MAVDQSSRASGRNDTAARASAAVDQDRLWSRHVEMAKIGATPNKGVHRLAYTAEETRARKLLLDWAGKRGYACALDDIGNMFIRRPGSDPAAAPVASGSHMDTQPKGGRYDGIYGVLAAFEAMEALDDAGIVTKRPIEAVAWAAEEGGARFPLGCMGSQVYTDPSKLATMLASKDHDGVTTAEAVATMAAALPPLAKRALKSPFDCFIEAHIEQGPELELAGKTIGVVTGIQGSRFFEVEVSGEAAHAGTTPERSRKDALKAAAAMIVGLTQLMHDPKDVVRFTIGRLLVSPNAMTVVPGHVFFTIDFRHPEDEVLDRLGNQIETVCQRNAGGCQVKVTQIRRGAVTKFTGIVPEAILEATRRLGFSHMHIPSGAGHDSRYTAAICPTGMIFVPCERGISHNETENATPFDLAAGAKVLAEVMVELANR